jgi:transposase-like protein
MSTKNKKSAGTGVRYSDAQKKEVVDFVAQYNSANGRGGQSAAAAKFKVTPLTISAWIKAAGGKAGGKKAKAAKAPKAPKAAKAPKAPKAAKKSSASKKGVRYTPEQKQEVVDFVNSYNSSKGRGGQSQAAKKFKLSVLTVSSWLKKGGVKTPKAVKATAVKAPKAVATAVPSGLAAKVSALLQVGDQIRKAESELQQLRAKYDGLSASVRASI